MIYESLGKYIAELYRHQQMMINNYLKPYNIGGGQYIFLLNIYKYEGISQKDLSKLLHVDKTTTTKAINKLEKEGYVYRVKGLQDKRYYRLYLTEKGINFIPTLKDTLKSISKILKTGMSETEFDEAIRLLKIMLRNSYNPLEF